MMRWERVRGPRAVHCGRCGETIPIGDPVLLLIIGPTTKTRCAQCDGPAPALPAYEPPAPVSDPVAASLPFSRFQVPAQLADDWKSRSAGEREPGEDG